MKTGDLVVYSDQETMPQWANTYGIITDVGWKSDPNLVLVWWAGEPDATIHYRYELEIITNKGRKYGEYLLARGKSPKRRSS